MRHLIVARYRENIEWVDEIEGWSPLVVTKNVDVANEGREASSYFWAIHKLYPSLEPSDFIACLQGNPFDHGDLKALDDPPDEFQPVGNWKVICDRDGAPHHPGLDLDTCYRRWLRGTPPGFYEFVAGGQFTVPARLILTKPDNYWRLMAGRMTGNGPWQMERLWGYLFTEEK